MVIGGRLKACLWIAIYSYASYSHGFTHNVNSSSAAKLLVIRLLLDQTSGAD